jgi:hypothetical protein
MEFFHAAELTIPVFQIALLLLLSTVALLFGRVKLALLINYSFTLYWGYGVNASYLIGSGFRNVDTYTLVYFGFGLCIVALAVIGFLSPSK